MARSRLSLIAINLAVFVALAEAAAAGVYFVQHGTFLIPASERFLRRCPKRDAAN